MKEKVLKLLIEANDFLSGEDISKSLGVSRTAIWKHINKLKQEGYLIESVTNKGYKISLQNDILNGVELASLIKETGLIRDVLVYEQIDSTNKEAKRKGMEGRGNLLIISEEQLSGSGRRGKGWVSAKNTGIYMTMLLKPDLTPSQGAMLTLIAGIAVLRAIKKQADMDCKIKWPNDIVLNNKKICGILTEMSSEIDFINYLVIGIGINVNQSSMEEDIKKIGTSLRLEGGQEYSRKQLIIQVIEEFTPLYNKYLEDKSLEFIIEEYNRDCINIGKIVKIEENKNIYLGKALMVNNEGELIVELEDKTIKTISSGEVSVRGLYGYVE